jgi:hypothetical protein
VWLFVAVRFAPPARRFVATLDDAASTLPEASHETSR